MKQYFFWGGIFLLWIILTIVIARNIVFSVIAPRPPTLRAGDAGRRSPPTMTPTPRVTLLTTGDVMIGRAVYPTSISRGDPLYPFRSVQSLLSLSDIVLINLETPLTDPCPTKIDGMIFCAPVSQATVLQEAGVDVASIANNHIRNYGEEGYASTIRALSSADILPIEQGIAAFFGKGGIRFGFVSFDLVTYPNIDEEQITFAVREAKEGADIVVVSFHWGAEYKKQPTEQQKKIAHLAVDSGANVVIGHHPHVTQPMEEYNGVPIIYSHGNFVFDQMWSEETKKGTIGKFVFEGEKLLSYEVIPIYMKNFAQPEVVE